MTSNRSFSRRRFLAGAVGVAAAGALGASNLGRSTPARATGPIPARIEDIRHGPPELDRLRGGSQRSLHGPWVVASFPFTHAGVHWSGAGPNDVQFHVRTSADGRHWTAWEPLVVEATPDQTPARETFAALVGAPGHRYLQYRATGRVDALDSVTATLIGTTARPGAGTASAVSDVPAHDTPVHFTREEWGADESLRFDDAGNEIWPRMYVPVKKLVVHHTATTNDYTQEEAAAEVRAIYTYHAVSLEWGDIGYNALVDRFGNIYEGRHGRGEGSDREVLGEGVVAGHALSHNYGSTGIAAIGTYTQRGEGGKPGIQPSTATLDAFHDVLAFEAGRNHVDPHGVGDFLLFDGTWNRGLENFSGHRDCNSTICPGGNLYDQLPGLRDGVAATLSRETPAVSLDQHPPEDTVSGGDASYTWSSNDASEFSYALEGWRQIGTGEDIEYLAGFTTARRLDWSAWDTATEANHSGLEDGFYTFHVRGRDANGVVSYQQARTLVMTTSNGDDGGDGGGDDGGSDDPAAISLDVTAYKVRGLQKADLAWSGATTTQVVIHRDGAVIATTDNDGAYTDHIDQRGSGSYVYQVCEADESGNATDVCSAEVTAEF